MSKAAAGVGFGPARGVGKVTVISPLRGLAWALGASLVLHALALTWLGPVFQRETSRLDETIAVIEARLAPPPDPQAPTAARADAAPLRAPPPVIKDTMREEPPNKAPPPPQQKAATPPPAPPAPEARRATPLPAPPVAEPLPPRELGRTYQRLSETLLYPEEAVRRGLQGEVVLLLEVGEGGRIAGASVASTSGHPILDDAALRAVRLLGTLGPASAGRAILLPVRFTLE
jgi:protein TonB